MKSSFQDKTEGNWHKIKGKIKQLTGKALRKSEMEADGKSENQSGTVQEKRGQKKDLADK